MRSAVVNRKSGLLLRSILSIVVLGGLIYHIGSLAIFGQMAVVPWSIIAIIVLLLSSHVLFVTPRWAAILSALGYHVRSMAVIGSVFLGFLFNQLLPTAVGGDVIRAWRVRQLGIPLDVAIHSVLIDRAAGLVVILVGAIALLPFVHVAAVHDRLVETVSVVGLVVIAGCLVVWSIGNLPPISMPVIGGLQRALSGLVVSTRALLRRPLALLTVVALASIGQLIPVAAIGLLAVELHVPLAPIDITVVTFGAMIAATIPLSVAGWGIREGALVFLFGVYGVPAETAFAISILFGACLLIASIPGALVLLFEGRPLETTGVSR